MTFPTDDDFVRRLPPPLREKAGRYFTPVAVARRASQMLRDANAKWVLDVGSGSGKFCVVAALESPAVQFVGVEQRAHLVDVARATADALVTIDPPRSASSGRTERTQLNVPVKLTSSTNRHSASV